MTEHKHKKSLGQNFLRDANVIQDIIELINPITGEHLLEIGPGEGALTKFLLEYDIILDAVEKDKLLIPKLTNKFGSNKNFRLHLADILEFELNSINRNNEHSKRKLRIIGNLPYNISTPLLFKLFKNLPIIADMYFMLQQEVANRLTANPGSKAYGRLSVMAQYHCEIYNLLTVPASAFQPIPKVVSSIVKFVPIANKSINASTKDLSKLQQIVTTAFNQRRKTIANSLKPWFNREQLLAAGISPTSRPEELAVRDFVRLTNLTNSA